MKEAWEVVKTMRLGADRVKDVNAQKLMQEFENIKFKEGESIDDFGMRINNLVGNLRALGETMEDTRVVKKFLRVVPSRFASVVVSIEMFCDMKALTVAELVGRLCAAEERLNDGVEQVTDKAGRLLLVEEDWLERNKHRLRGAPNKEGAGGSGGGQTKNKAPAACSQGGNNGGVKLTSMGTPRRKGCCRNCGIYGHSAEDCKRPKKEKKKEAQQPEANVAVAGHEQGALMLATCDVVHAPHQIVHMTENVIPVEVPNDEWVLDTGASNHMTGTRSALSQLDASVRGSVHFGDGSRVEIQGVGSVVIQDRQHGHKVLTDVYYIPQLKSNIISLGQLEEKGFKYLGENGRLRVFDQAQTLLISAPRSGNRLYLAKLSLVPPVCLLAQTDDASWLWHARYGHLNFRALSDLSAKQMVEGLPTVTRVEKNCNGCVLGKQHRAPFPKVSSFRAGKCLELVHADLCGHITPKTVGVLPISCW